MDLDRAGHVGRATRENLGFLLAKASQRWNELLGAEFRGVGYADVRPAHGSILLALFEEDGLRMGELARRARLSKQTLSSMIRAARRRGLVTLRADATDQRATRVFLAPRAKRFREASETVLARVERCVERRLSAREIQDLRRALKHIADMELEVER